MNDFVNRLSGFRKIQAGGEATVYRAILDGKTPVAVRIATEAVTSGAESARPICEISGTPRFYGAGTVAGRAFSVSEYISGVPSSAMSPMPPRIALRLLRKANAAVAAFAASGTFHGDVSPENLLIDSSERIVLIDGGIRGLGTPKFAAPERFEGAPASVRGELFSLGSLLYFWIAGEPLFGGETFGSVENAVFQVDSYDESLLLHGKGKLSPDELQTFSPLWKGTLRRDPSARFEDFDEWDECLEIAENKLNSVSSGVEAENAAIWKDELARRVRDREDAIAASSETTNLFAIPDTIRPETKVPTRRIVRIAVALLSLTLLFLFIFLKQDDSPEVENVGKSMLESTRSQQRNDDPEQIGPDSTIHFVRGVVSEADSLSASGE